MKKFTREYAIKFPDGRYYTGPGYHSGVKDTNRKGDIHNSATFTEAEAQNKIRETKGFEDCEVVKIR